MVTQVYNPSYLGGGDQEDHGLRPTGQKLTRPASQPMAGCGGKHLSSPATHRSKNRRITIQARMGIK
jgi:hypothetical protein